MALKKILSVIPWGILLLSFAVLAFCYNSIADEVVIARAFFGNPAVLAGKSFFTVFRVPLIDTICAVIIAIVLRRLSIVAPRLSNFWLVLLYTAACKSLLQAFEIVSPPNVSDIFFYMTIAIVAAGIASAFFFVRNNLSGFFKSLGKLDAVESLALVLLLIAYLGIGIVPMFVFR